ncbi:acetate--CoA ligase [Sandaracinus amylolyticus]|uniref:Acetyl-coenzyme A synthetase n=1 Tax=Sandaracinus amylolyticus TaxID=927083 RepID=A0A0F6SHA8_9BACT|nr:acetate--CoA ligase [Sandaracinus amylolyticus]AKF10119.1 Acetyl-coenzyme A synthetase [Sandaracinus amylolyticus]
MSQASIQSVSRESRIFAPQDEFARQARVSSREGYEELYRRSVDDPDAFWLEIATEDFHWFKKPTQGLDWSNPPHAKWFADGTTNLAYNCLDRHLVGSHRNKAAIIFEGEPGDVRVLTYQQLHREVCRFANVLGKLGVKQGDCVAIYMGMVPEAAIAMLACARIGAIHTVIFGGFAAEAVRDRVNDAKAKLIVTQDGAWRRGNLVPLKENVDRAMRETPGVKHTIVLKRTGNEVAMDRGRDLWWHEMVETVSAQHRAAELPAEHPLFILYTSGTTGKPKGVLHTTGGYMVGAATTSKFVFDLREDDTYWCTADVGWVTGHSYIAYGPLANGATCLMYEGAPNHPDPGRFWSIIERHGVTILYTAPTAIRAFVKWGDQYPMKHDLSSLRLLGTVGEPINPEAWMWYRRVIGNERCPIVDTWWQTETGAMMMTPLPGAISTKPGSCTVPFFGVVPKVLREDGTEAGPNEGGLLVIEKPWPSMMRTVYGDDQRFKDTYWSRFEGKYFTGDGARKDEDGFFWVMGRVDDVVNVAGHRLGTAEVESALVAHKSVAEAAVVGRPDELKGQGLVAFVTLKQGEAPTKALKAALLEHVAQEIGKFARPDEIRFTDGLPKTRSGKIMRRLLKELASGNEVKGDMTTLEDFSVLAKLRADEE